jgi:hypothetical protein
LGAWNRGCLVEMIVKFVPAGPNLVEV